MHIRVFLEQLTLLLPVSVEFVPLHKDDRGFGLCKDLVPVIDGLDPLGQRVENGKAVYENLATEVVLVVDLVENALLKIPFADWALDHDRVFNRLLLLIEILPDCKVELAVFGLNSRSEISKGNNFV